MQPQHEVLDAERQDPHKVAHDNLARSLGGLIDLGVLAPNTAEEQWWGAEERAFEAIHQYADAHQIGVDEEGMEQRRDFAKAINAKLRRGVNPFMSQMIADPVVFTSSMRQRGFLDEPGSEIPADSAARFDAAACAAATAGHDKTPPIYMGGGRFDTAPPVAEVTPEAKPQRRFLKRAILGGLGFAALAGITIFGITRGDSDSAARELDERPVATAQQADRSSTTLTTATTIQPETTTTIEPAAQTHESGYDPIPPQPSAALEVPVLEVDPLIALAVPRDSSVWRTLRKSFAVPELPQEELDKRILAAMPHLKADNPDISDLNYMNPGDLFVVGPAASDILRGNAA